MIKIGDIVEIQNRSGAWVVMNEGTWSRVWRVRQDRSNGPPLGFEAGEGALNVLLTPTFTPGQKLKYAGLPCEVVEVEPDGSVLVFVERDRQLRGGGRINLDGNTRCARAHLVAENATKLLRQEP